MLKRQCLQGIFGFSNISKERNEILLLNRGWFGNGLGDINCCRRLDILRLKKLTIQIQILRNDKINIRR